MQSVGIATEYVVHNFQHAFPWMHERRVAPTCFAWPGVISMNLLRQISGPCNKIWLLLACDSFPSRFILLTPQVVVASLLKMAYAACATTLRIRGAHARPQQRCHNICHAEVDKFTSESNFEDQSLSSRVSKGIVSSLTAVVNLVIPAQTDVVERTSNITLTPEDVRTGMPQFSPS